MSNTQCITVREEEQVPHDWDNEAVAEELGKQLAEYLYPLLVLLDSQVDKRLVRTFLLTVQTIITFRDRINGLLLSELGGYLAGPEHAPAGTKRIGSLIRSEKWDSRMIEEFLFWQADKQLQKWKQTGYDGIACWDSSVIEKPESQELEGLCPVHSSKAARRTRIRKGYYHPPVGRICVAGMHWLAVTLVPLYQTQGTAILAAMRWWTSRGIYASFERDEQARLLQWLAQAWGRQVVHVFDQGFAGLLWLRLCLGLNLRFVLRWRKDYHLVDAKGMAKAAWKIAKGKRGWPDRKLWDSRRHRSYQGGVVAMPVSHPQLPGVPLWLVVARGLEHPWYLLTSDPVTTEEEAWNVVFAYMRRWQIEVTWRYDKSELAFESPRVVKWEHRVRLLLLATLAYGFLLSLLKASHLRLRLWLLRHWCHRTGQHARNAQAPLYRLRSAISQLWRTFPRAFAWVRRRATSPPPRFSISICA
jgi:hypothetical protein